MKHLEAVHGGAICCQVGAKCGQVAFLSLPPPPPPPRHPSGGCRTVLFVSITSPRPWVVTCAQGDCHVPRASPRHLPRRRVAPRPPRSPPPRAPCPLAQRHAARMDGGTPYLSHPVEKRCRGRVPAPPGALGRAGHRPSLRRRLPALTWHDNAAADLARRRMGPR